MELKPYRVHSIHTATAKVTELSDFARDFLRYKALLWDVKHQSTEQ
jgi:hypothetical protein